MEQVYKVVYRAGNRLTSMYAMGDLTVEYRPQRWVEAPVGGLLAFADYKPASEFAIGLGEIWLAEADEFIPLPPCGLGVPASDLSLARAVWESVKTGDMPWPEGTVAFRRIRLVERIE